MPCRGAAPRQCGLAAAARRRLAAGGGRLCRRGGAAPRLEWVSAERRGVVGGRGRLEHSAIFWLRLVRGRHRELLLSAPRRCRGNFAVLPSRSAADHSHRRLLVRRGGLATPGRSRPAAALPAERLAGGRRALARLPVADRRAMGRPGGAPRRQLQDVVAGAAARDVRGGAVVPAALWQLDGDLHRPPPDIAVDDVRHAARHPGRHFRRAAALADPRG
mmetsp:Transcript_132874/g.384162  ORF Transcript_132874/g.384162 Transcript_132874/m.384162 type:complete len:218 (-) Transcript_132874:730-1383(-)